MRLGAGDDVSDSGCMGVEGTLCGVGDSVEEGGEVSLRILDHSCLGDLCPSVGQFGFVLVRVVEQDVEPVSARC